MEVLAEMMAGDDAPDALRTTPARKVIPPANKRFR